MSNWSYESLFQDRGDDGADKELTRGVILPVGDTLPVTARLLPEAVMLVNVGVEDVARVIDPLPFVTDIFVPAVSVAFASVLPVLLPIRSWPSVYDV